MLGFEYAEAESEAEGQGKKQARSHAESMNIELRADVALSQAVSRRFVSLARQASNMAYGSAWSSTSHEDAMMVRSPPPPPHATPFLQLLEVAAVAWWRSTRPLQITRVTEVPWWHPTLARRGDDNTYLSPVTGSVEGERYFRCREKHGLFVRPQRVSDASTCPKHPSLPPSIPPAQRVLHLLISHTLPTAHPPLLLPTHPSSASHTTTLPLAHPPHPPPLTHPSLQPNAPYTSSSRTPFPPSTAHPSYSPLPCLQLNESYTSSSRTPSPLPPHHPSYPSPYLQPNAPYTSFRAPCPPLPPSTPPTLLACALSFSISHSVGSPFTRTPQLPVG